MNSEAANIVEQLRKIVQAASSTSSSQQSSPSASGIVGSLRTDDLLARNVGRIFGNSSSGNAGGQASGTNARPPLPSFHQRSSGLRYMPYIRRKKGENSKSYDMKLVVVDHIYEVKEFGQTNDYKGDSLIEAPFRVQDREQDGAIRPRVLNIIKSKYKDYDGSYFYVMRSGRRNNLTMSATQEIDGKSVYTIKSKSTNTLYVMLSKPASNVIEDDDDDPEEEQGEEIESIEDEASLGAFPSTSPSQNRPQRSRTRQTSNPGGNVNTFRNVYQPTVVPNAVNDDDRPPDDYNDESEKTHPQLFCGYSQRCKLFDPPHSNTGFVNPNGKKCSLSSVLSILQWLRPFMADVENRSTEICKIIKKCYAVRGTRDARAGSVQDSLLTTLGLSGNENLDPNEVLEKILENTLQHSQDNRKAFCGKTVIVTSLDSSQSGEIIFDTKEDESLTSKFMINVAASTIASDSLSIRDHVNERLKESDPVQFEDWNEAWKSKYSESCTDGSNRAPIAKTYHKWSEVPDILIIALQRNTEEHGVKNNKAIDIPRTFPEADLLHPENETLHGIEDYQISYFLFAIVVHSEQRDHLYSIVKNNQTENKWTVYDGLLVKSFEMTDNLLKSLSGGGRNDSFITLVYTKSWDMIQEPTSPDDNIRKNILESIGSDDDCVILEERVRHEEILHNMEKAMAEFVGLENLKEQFMRFTKTQLQNDRRRMLGHNVQHNTPLHLVFAGNPGTGKTTFARRVAELLYSIKKIRRKKVVEVQRSDLVGQYLGSTTEKTKDKIAEARGGVLFVDEAYRLIPTAGGKDFGRESIEELMSVMEKGDPVMIFAGYEKMMAKFLKVNMGLQSRIYRKFVFPDYTVEELGKIFRQRVKEKQYNLAADVNVDMIIQENTTERQRSMMNARLMRLLLQESIEEASNRVPLQAPLQELLELKASDVVAAASRLPRYEDADDIQREDA